MRTAIAIARSGAMMCLCAFALLALPLDAAAQPRGSPSQARDHVRAGMAYAERGKWEDALREFEEAYALEPQPLRLFDVAQARFKTNRFRAAADAYAKLVDAPSLSPEQHERVRAGLASAREKIAHVRISVTNARAGDVVTIDGAAVGREVLVDLDPGHHVARLVRDGETTESAVDVEPGATTTITLTAKSKDANVPPRATMAPPPPEAPKKAGTPALTWVLAGTSLVSLSFGAYFGFVGLTKYNRLKDDPCGAQKTCGRAESNSMRMHIVAADVLLGAGVLTAGGAVLLWYLSRSSPAEPKDEKAGTIRIVPALGGGTLAITF